MVRVVWIAALITALASSARADSVGFSINYIDAAGTGFNAAGAAGLERRTAFEYAMSKYAGLFEAQYVGETIRIDAQFTNTTFLGEADAAWYIYGPLPKANTYYSGPLANHLAGFDVQTGVFGDPGGHIDIEFANTLIDGGGDEFYFGTDGSTPGGQYDFVTVAIHEIMHGLGQISLVHGDTGRLGLNDPSLPQFPQIYDHFVFDTVSGKTFVQMTDAERLAAIQGGDLVWIGPNAQAANGATRFRSTTPPCLRPEAASAIGTRRRSPTN